MDELIGEHYGPVTRHYRRGYTGGRLLRHSVDSS